MNTTQLKTAILAGAFDNTFRTLYTEERVSSAKIRYANAVEAFESIYGAKQQAVILSVPGRSEITGNHTDHNHGRVIAASVDCDVIAVAAKTADGTVRIKSDGYKEDAVSITALDPKNFPQFKSIGLVAGMCDAFKKNGLTIGGLCAYTTSNVLKGSGLSSSAAFEVMVGTILNHLYNGGAVSPIDVARYAQWSENVYFGKPCGLMDQMACAVGGFVEIDFEDPAKPIVEKISFDLTGMGYDLCIVNTGGNHADLNDDYASIPGEMKKVASLFGKDVLRGLTEEDLLEKASEIRKVAGDRALLRALHFVNEDARVPAIAAAMKEGDIARFLGGITTSGNSSFKYLQNVFTTKNPAEQGESLAIYLSERALASFRLPGACRVHGGGFAGTMQAFVPRLYTEAFRQRIDAVMGEGSCMVMHVRPLGATRVDND
jgi:galactokinase